MACLVVIVVAGAVAGVKACHHREIAVAECQAESSIHYAGCKQQVMDRLWLED